MRLIFLVILIFTLSACSIDTRTNLFSSDQEHQFILYANKYVGYSETENRTELKQLMRVDPVRTEWCAAFVNAILEKQNMLGSGSVHHNPLLARSFINWGKKVSRANIQPGDIIVFPRGGSNWQGHVGFYAGKHASGRWIILGGNQGNQVSYMLFRPTYAISIRRAHKKSNL